jgi:hypothetical protein
MALAFFLILLVAGAAMWVLRKLLKQVMELSFKDGFEKMGGLSAGALRTTVVICAVLFIVVLIPHDYLHRVVAQDAWLGRMLCRFGMPAYERLTEKYPELPGRPTNDAGRVGSDTAQSSTAADTD